MFLAQALLACHKRFKSEPDGLQQTALTFAKQFGLLTADSKSDRVEQLETWQGLIKKLIAVHKAFEAGRWELDAGKFTAVTNISASLVPDALTHRPTLILEPGNLRGAIWLQFAYKLARGAVLKTCLQCGTYFEAGVEGVRLDAKFCSQRCRHAYNNERRRAESA